MRATLAVVNSRRMPTVSTDNAEAEETMETSRDGKSLNSISTSGVVFCKAATALQRARLLVETLAPAAPSVNSA